MERVRLAGAFKAIILAMLIVALLRPQVAADIAGASGSDTPAAVPTRTFPVSSVDTEDAENGFTIIAPYFQRSVFLVDHEGDIVHTWTSDRLTTGTVELLGDGTLIRGRSGTGGQPYGVHILDWDGTVLWDYTPPAPYERHHDIEVMPSGNILLNAAQEYNRSQMVDMGRDATITTETLWLEPILEVRPNGTTGGDIVWIWDPADHLVQDHDSEKPNYGVVADHPELLDINFPRDYTREWQHTNAVTYNEELDQIMITSRNFGELWVVDHSTSTEEAAGHTGGAQGMGGDILYRWGNPQAYDAGDADDHVLWGPHDAQWVPPGYPGEGNIIVFNNGKNMNLSRPQGEYSSVEELVPPVNSTGGYHRDAGSAFGPRDLEWQYVADPPEAFFGEAMGSVERLPGGNTLICGGSNGKVIEVSPEGDVEWDYSLTSMFKAGRFYPPAIEPLPVLNATEDVMTRVNLSSAIWDLDTDPDNLIVRENSSHASVSGLDLVLQYPEGVTTDVFNLTVTDGIFQVGTEVRVVIRPVNDPPTLGSIPLIAVVESVPRVLHLGPYIHDPDTDLDQMTITVDSAHVTVDGEALTFLYPDGVLTDQVALTVSDGEFTVHGSISVSVTPYDDPPRVDTIPDQEGAEDVPWTIDLTAYVSDVDTPIEGLSVVSSSMYTSLSGLNLTFLYPEGVTSDTVVLTVSDGVGEDSVEFDVTVAPVNDPPIIDDLPPVTVTEDRPYSLDVRPSLSDIDTPLEELVVSTNSPYVQVRGHRLVLTFPDGVLQGEVLVEVSDGELMDDTTLWVTVEPVNDPPWWTPLPDVSAVEDVEGELDLAPYMNDVDTPLAGLAVSVESVHGWMDGHVFRYSYPDGVLSELVTFTLSDGELSATGGLNVTVSPVNDAPLLLDAQVGPPDGNEKAPYRFTVIFKDVDLGSDQPVVEVVVDGVTHRCTRDESDTRSYEEGVVFVHDVELDPGTHTFHFCADDCGGHVVSTEPLTVRVEEVPDGEGGTRSPSLMAPLAVACAVAAVVVLVLLRRRLPGPSK